VVGGAGVVEGERGSWVALALIGQAVGMFAVTNVDDMASWRHSGWRAGLGHAQEVLQREALAPPAPS
jgi:hypothetical protein